MYGLMVAFEPTRVTPVSGGRKEGMNFGKVAVKSGTAGTMVAAVAQGEILSVGSVGGNT